MSEEKVTVTLDDATLAQLREFAGKVGGIGEVGNLNSATLRTRLRKITNPPHHITVGGADEAPSPAVQEPPPPVQLAKPKVEAAKKIGGSVSDPIVHLIVDMGTGKDGARPIKVGVNGNIMLIPRGKEVPVPYRYYLAMDIAVQTLYDQDEETQEMHEREVHTYTHRVTKMPAQEILDAWHEADRTPPAPPISEEQKTMMAMRAAL